MKYIFSLFLFFCLTNAFVYSQKINLITYKSRNESKVPIVETLIKIENNDIEVKVYVQSFSIFPNDTVSNATTIDTVYTIKTQAFEKLSDAVLALPSTALLANISFRGLVGTQTSIEFGNDFNSIIYRVWSPNVETKKRELDPYINLCKLIVKVGKLNFKDLL